MKRVAITAKFPSTRAVAKSLRAFGFFRDSSDNSFGTFATSKRKARTGRNPQTGKPIKIAAKKVARFSAGKQLKDSVPLSRAGAARDRRRGIVIGLYKAGRETGQASAKKSARSSARKSFTRKAAARKSTTRGSTKKSSRR